MKELLEYIKTEWETISNAPFTIIILIALLTGIVYLVLRWRFQGIIENLKEQINTYLTRLILKDEQLDKYRDELYLESREHRKYTKLSNDEVIENALALVKDVRKFINERKEIEHDIFMNIPIIDNRKQSEEEIKQIYDKNFQKITKKSLETINLYNSKYKVNVIVIKDELLTRIKNKNDIKIKNNNIFEHPVNLLVIEDAITSLELLAKKLK